MSRPLAKGKKQSKRDPKGPEPVGRGPDGAAGAEGIAAGSLLDRAPWLPVVLYAIMALALFRDFVFSDRMLMGTDTLSLGYMAREFFAQSLRNGIFPLWNPIILGGTPFLESVAGGDSLYPTSLLLLVMDTYRALGWKLVLHLPLAGGFMYLWIRSLGRSRGSALLAGLGFMLAPYMVSLVYPGQDGKLFVTALTPLVFWMTDRLFSGPRPIFVAGLALAVALVILTTHFQMAYFLFGAVGCFGIFRAVQLARSGGGTGLAVTRFGMFMAAALLGAGVSAVQLLPSVQYVLEDSRRTATTTDADPAQAMAYSASWSLHPEEAVSLVVPEFVGNNAGGSDWTTDTYWGRNPFKLNHEYIGLLVLLLAGLSFLGAPDAALRQFFLALGGIALLFTLGANTPIWKLFYQLVPGIDLFRAPSMAIFLTGFSASTLMGYGVDRGLEIARGGDASRERQLFRYLGGWGIVVLVFLGLAASGLLFSAWTATVYSGIAAAKAAALERAIPFVVRGAGIALALTLATGAVWWALARRKIPEAVAVALLAGLLVLDLGRVCAPFVQTLDFYRWSAANEHESYLMEAQRSSSEPFRVLSMVQAGQDVRPGMFGIELAAGHHPNDLARYRQLIGMEGSGVPRNFFAPGNQGMNLSLLWTLNVRYLLWPDYQFGLLGLEPASRITLPNGQPYSSLYQIPEWQPRAYLVDDFVVEPGTEAVGVLYRGEVDPRIQVVLGVAPDPDWGVEPGEGAPGSVTWLEKGPDRIRLQVTAARPSFLVVSENWLPGWKAETPDGELPVIRANHTLQAVPVPAGEYELTLAYRPDPLRRAGIVSGVSALLLLLLLFAEIRERRLSAAPDEA